MVNRLDAADALALHSQTTTTPGARMAVLVLGASDPLTHARLHRLLASSLAQLARFRSRLVDKPLGLGQPVWAEIDDYDPTPHIQRVSVPEPGNGRALTDLLTQLSAQPHDWRRSLWKGWTIDGLSGARWALAVKMSPVLNDDDVASVWQRLLSGMPNDSRNVLPTEAHLGSTPTLGELVADTAIETIENQIKGSWLIAKAATGVLQALRRPTSTDGPPSVSEAVFPTSGRVARSVFNAPLTKRRSMAFASIPLVDVTAVSHAFGGSTANVMLAACTLSLRAWLQRNVGLPHGPLVMQVPMSLPAGDPAKVGKSLAAADIRLPVQLSDPVQVLTDLHTAAERLNIANDSDEGKMDPAVDPVSLLSLLPPALAHAGLRVYAQRGLIGLRAPRRDGRVSFTSVRPGPAYCAGAKVIGMHTAGPLEEGCGLNISITSHADAMDLCLCACPDNVPGVDDIATGIVEAIDSLLAAASKSPRGEGRSVVTEMTSHAVARSHRI